MKILKSVTPLVKQDQCIHVEEVELDGQYHALRCLSPAVRGQVHGWLCEEHFTQKTFQKKESERAMFNRLDLEVSQFIIGQDAKAILRSEGIEV